MTPEEKQTDEQRWSCERRHTVQSENIQSYLRFFMLQPNVKILFSPHQCTLNVQTEIYHIDIGIQVLSSVLS